MGTQKKNKYIDRRKKPGDLGILFFIVNLYLPFPLLIMEVIAENESTVKKSHK